MFVKRGNYSLLEVTISIWILTWIFLFIFIICEPGERVSEKFEEFSNELGQCNWYALPSEMQRMYLIFLSDAQQPINIQCYGRILCSRETFKTVILY